MTIGSLLIAPMPASVKIGFFEINNSNNDHSAIKNNIKHTHSVNNIGLCSSMNKAYHLTTSNYILYAHDDMFFCDNWDLFLIEEIDKYDHNFYYLTGTNVSTRFGLINHDCGNSISNFNEKKFIAWISSYN